MNVVLGSKLRKLRERSGMTTRVLGEKIGKSNSQVTKYEMGIHEPTLKILLKYKEIFNVSLDYLCDDSRE